MPDVCITSIVETPNEDICLSLVVKSGEICVNDCSLYILQVDAQLLNAGYSEETVFNLIFVYRFNSFASIMMAALLVAYATNSIVDGVQINRTDFTCTNTCNKKSV